MVKRVVPGSFAGYQIIQNAVDKSRIVATLVYVKCMHLVLITAGDGNSARPTRILEGVARQYGVDQLLFRERKSQPKQSRS